MNCQTCTFGNQENARFCGGCGKPLSAGDSVPFEAERRHLSVLFCDLVDSTPLSQQLDAEDFRTVMVSYQRACEAVVFRHAGFVAQYRGDSIEVYFGYPLAHEDDASRVVRCALAMVEAVRQLAETTRVALQVRIGIHIGRAVVGVLGGPNPSEQWAIGDTPNIAARVQAQAAPGEVVVSDSLQRLLPGMFAVEPMGFHQLKGVERPVELFKVVASGGQAAGLNIPLTPFLGRARELQHVQQVWTLANSGVPQFMLLSGEPGIGKSRLVEVIQSKIADDRTDVLMARCTPVGAATAFQPVSQLVSLRLGLDGVPPEEQVARIATRMVELGLAPEEAVPLFCAVLSLPVDPARWPAPALSPARTRQRTMEIVIAALYALALHNPVLVIVEDMHWADPSTVELIGQLMVSPRHASLMVLLTARQEFRPAWKPAANVTEIELPALDAQEAEALIRKVALDKPLPPDVVWQIQERAAGNPLFLEEITRSVTESGVLVARQNSWELVGRLSADVVPASMEASLMARIDRLGEARTLLQLGATLGREFSHELLVAVARLPEDLIQRQIDIILESGLIFRRGHESVVYFFKHALIRDSAYDSLLRATRRTYHARIVEVLSARFPAAAQIQPELLAHHFSGAGLHAEAAAHWRAAGENAAKRSAMKEAVAHLRRALDDLERFPEDAVRLDHELAVLTALAPALMAVYGWAAAVSGETCQRAIEIARRLGANERMLAPLWGLWTNRFVGGRLDAAMETAAEVMNLAVAAGDPKLVALGYDAKSYTHCYRAEFDEAMAEADIGLRLCSPEMDLLIRESFHISAMGSLMITKASALWMQGRQDAGIAVVNDLISHVRSFRHPPSVATGLATAMFFCLYDRDWTRMFTISNEVYELSRAEGFSMWTANAGLHRGRARIGLGEVTAGVAEVLEWGALFRQTGSGLIEGSTTSMISEAMHMAGRSEEALVVSAEGERRAKLGHVGLMMPEIYRTRGDILRDLSRLDEADEAYCMAVDCAGGQGASSLELRAMTALLDLRLSRGQPGILPAALRRSLEAMACRSGRPDLVTARELLGRIRL